MILFPSIKLYQPTFLYSYCAIILQGGALQIIGCLGAIRLNEKLLNLYLLLLIALLFGDGIIGIVWILRFNAIVANLRGDLKSRLNNDYANDKEFQDLWDSIQSESQCCGIDGPFDFNTSTLIGKEYEILVSGQLIPKSCCRMNTAILPNEHLSIKHKCVTDYGCYDHIHHWLQHSADLLSVLGFCVISFIKICFLCILRYEIKEMIQKIKVLKGMAETPPVPVHDLEVYLPRPSVQQDSTQTLLSNTAPQSTYRTGCTSDKHYHILHHHIIPTANSGNTANNARMSAIINGNNNDLCSGQSKKHSIV